MNARFLSLIAGKRFWLLLVIVAVASTILARGYLNRPLPVLRGPTEASRWLAQHPVPTHVAHFEERLSAPGKNAVSRRVTVGIRADGSRAVLEQIYNVNKGIPSHTARQLYLSSGVVASVWDELRVYSAWRDNNALQSAEGPRLDAETDCQSDYYGRPRYKRSGDDERLLGFRSVPLKFVSEGRSMQTQSWRLPELGCIEGRRLATFLDKNGEPSSTSDLVATSITLTAPDEQMFKIPEDYEPVVPSEAILRVAAFVHGAPPPPELLRRGDEYYLKNQVDISSVK